MKKVYLVGIGCGNADGMTIEADKIIKGAQVIVGAGRMLEAVGDDIVGKKSLPAYKADEIARFLRTNTFESAAVLLSGDVGFYSGAKKLATELAKDGDFDVELISGISSMVYFCNKLQIAWENVHLVSSHGREVNLIAHINHYDRTFALLSGNGAIHELCEKLIYYGMENVTLHIGTRLSYDDECITHGTPSEILAKEFDKLCVMVCENPEAVSYVCHSIPDSEFERNKTPMTKEEVRQVSIGKLCLEGESVIYDIGAGTGSVSVEMAMQSPDIRVFAIEKNEEALQVLKKNIKKFRTDNVSVVEGEAPEVLSELPIPTHAFIGGSGGNLKEILDELFKKNPDIKIVVNTVSLNSIARLTEIIEGDESLDASVVQICAARGRKLGKYQMMTGENPIWIVSLCKK